MARHATLGFYGRVFEDKGTCLFRVATEADLILGCGGSELPGQESAVLIVAIAACEQALIYPMMHGFRKLGSYFLMAAITEHRLGHLQQGTLHFCVMRRMAIDASHIVLQVLRTQKVRVLFAKLMTVQTALARFLPGEQIETNNLGNVPSTVNVSLSRTVAGLAALILHTAVVEHGFPVGTVIVALGNLIVARTAGIGAHIQ
jgi:hypothetical protein